MTNTYDPGTGKMINVDGQLVEADALRIAEAIRDYDPNLVLLTLDPNRGEGITDEPFIVAERCPDGVLRPVLKAWTLNDLILERIRLADNNRHSTLAAVEQMEKIRTAQIEGAEKELKESTAEVVAGILATNKSRYTAPHPRTGELLTIRDFG